MEGASNKSLDASGGCVFRIMIGPAMLELNARRRVNFYEAGSGQEKNRGRLVHPSIRGHTS